MLTLALAALGCDRPVPRDRILENLAAAERPHIVLVVVDTLRADWTTPYGSELDTSPELARWAARGVLFEQARSQSSWTKISMASMMTSLWPRSHAIREARDGLAAEALTLAEVLRDAGYETRAVQTNGWLHQSFGFHQGFQRYVFPTGIGGGPMARPSVWAHAQNVLGEAQRLIDAHDPAKPLFLYVHFMDVHEYASPPDSQRFGTDDEGAYRNAIGWVDSIVADLRDTLDSAGLLERTTMIFTSDHGETFGEHGVHGHARNVLTPVVWVPLVLRLPFATEPVRVRSQVRSIDIAPTLLELAGVAVPRSFEGRSLLPLIVGDEPEADRPNHASLGTPLFPDSSVQSALSDGTWTYARNADEDPEESHHPGRRGYQPGREFLFDRTLDPGEVANLIEHEPETATRFREALDRHQAAAVQPVKRRGVRIDSAVADRLRALGYLR